MLDRLIRALGNLALVPRGGGGRHIHWPGTVSWIICKAAGLLSPLAEGWAQQGGSRAKMVPWVENGHGCGAYECQPCAVLPNAGALEEHTGSWQGLPGREWMSSQAGHCEPIFTAKDCCSLWMRDRLTLVELANPVRSPGCRAGATADLWIP